MNEPTPEVKEPIPEFAPPFFVYLTFLVAALAIGSERSCSGGLGFYALLGIAGLLVLLVCPFIVSRKRGPVIQFVTGIFYFLLGIAVWAGSFALGDMRFMCSLF